MESLQLTHTNPFWFLAAALSLELQTCDLGLHQGTEAPLLWSHMAPPSHLKTDSKIRFSVLNGFHNLFL